MLAGAPGCEISIGHEHPHLDTWIHTEGRYQHVSTGARSTSKPTTNRIVEGRSSQPPSTPSWGGRESVSFQSDSSLSPSPAPLETPERFRLRKDNLVHVRWDEARNRFAYRTRGGETGHFTEGALLLDTQGASYQALRDGANDVS